MIQIVQGTYGMVVGRSVEAVRAGDPPITLPPGRERELVEAGIARYVDTPLQGIAQGAPDAGPTVETPKEQATGLPDYRVGLKFDELKRIAQLYGVDEDKLRAANSKVKVVALIDELVEAQPDEDDDPPPPPLDVEVPR